MSITPVMMPPSASSRAVVRAAKVVKIGLGKGIGVEVKKFFSVPDLGQYPGGFAALLAEAEKGTLKYRDPHYGDMSQDASALTIGLDDDAYVVMVLDAAMAAQFSRSAPPFSDGQRGGSKDASAPTCVIGGIAGKSGAPAPQDGCKIAYFAILFKQYGNKGHGAFHKHRFNIHLETVTAINGQRVVTPIIIDPEVRHPPTGGVG